MSKIVKIPLKPDKIKKDVSKNEIVHLQKNCEKWVNMLYLNESFEQDKLIIKSFKRKLNGYKSQDVKKKRYDVEKFITYDELVEKLVISKLLCHYCRGKCTIITEKKRDETQWTLDRVNNDIGHYNSNVVISCLKCNLQKRRRADEHFKFAKQMRIIKHY